MSLLYFSTGSDNECYPNEYYSHVDFSTIIKSENLTVPIFCTTNISFEGRYEIQIRVEYCKNLNATNQLGIIFKNETVQWFVLCVMVQLLR